MAFDRTNKGTLADNPRKESDRHPDKKGQINIEGRDYWLSGWEKVNSNDGSIFWSLSAQPKEQSSAQRSPRQEQVTQRPMKTSYDEPKQNLPSDLDDEIPF